MAVALEPWQLRGQLARQVGESLRVRRPTQHGGGVGQGDRLSLPRFCRGRTATVDPDSVGKQIRGKDSDDDRIGQRGARGSLKRNTSSRNAARCSLASPKG